MSVNRRKASCRDSSAAPPEGSPAMDAGIDDFVTRLRAGRGVQLAIRDLVDWSWLGGYFTQQSVLARLSRETLDGGRLYGVPEARLAIAALAIETGDRERA